jgi:hypothetical protein
MDQLQACDRCGKLRAEGDHSACRPALAPVLATLLIASLVVAAAALLAGAV